MLSERQVDAARVMTVEMERMIRIYLEVETDPLAQRAALGVYRHAHALRVALEQWQHVHDAQET